MRGMMEKTINAKIKRLQDLVIKNCTVGVSLHLIKENITT
jgi:hypothetical protein